jgi:crossover junction endodeoxyribonuclease RusA
MRLNPNKRLHWALKAKVTSKARTTWGWELTRFKASLKGKTEFAITFAPPDKKRRDVDNAIASSKPLLDALADITGIDDSKFKIAWGREFMRPMQGGAVFVEVLA